CHVGLQVVLLDLHSGWVVGSDQPRERRFPIGDVGEEGMRTRTCPDELDIDRRTVRELESCTSHSRRSDTCQLHVTRLAAGVWLDRREDGNRPAAQELLWRREAREVLRREERAEVARGAVAEHQTD